jgi:transcription initiation factor TFIID TATA-box-binding protein
MNETDSQFKQLLEETGVATVESEMTLTVNNVVCVGDIGEDINLNALVVGLGVAEVEYEPEQFPGLVYRPDDADCVLLVFGTGKVVVTGSTSRAEAQAAFDSFGETYRELVGTVT